MRSLTAVWALSALSLVPFEVLAQEGEEAPDAGSQVSAREKPAYAKSGPVLQLGTGWITRSDDGSFGNTNLKLEAGYRLNAPWFLDWFKLLGISWLFGVTDPDTPTFHYSLVAEFRKDDFGSFGDHNMLGFWLMGGTNGRLQVSCGFGFEFLTGDSHLDSGLAGGGFRVDLDFFVTPNLFLGVEGQLGLLAEMGEMEDEEREKEERKKTHEKETDDANDAMNAALFLHAGYKF